MVRHPKPPSQSWRAFLNNHAKDIASVDFFTVPTSTFRVLYAFLVLSNNRRGVVHFKDCPQSRLVEPPEFGPFSIEPLVDGSKVPIRNENHRYLLGWNFQKGQAAGQDRCRGMGRERLLLISGFRRAAYGAETRIGDMAKGRRDCKRGCQSRALCTSVSAGMRESNESAQ
jgi:hypothetical protein